MRDRLGDRDREDQPADERSSAQVAGSQLERRRVSARARGRRSAPAATAWRAAAAPARRWRAPAPSQRAPLAQDVRAQDARAGELMRPAPTSRSRVRAAPSRSSAGGRRRRSRAARGRWPLMCVATCSTPRSREPPRAAGLLVLLRRRVRDDERRHARAEQVERRVVAALADARGGALQLPGEVRDGAQQLDVGRPQPRSPRQFSSGISGPAIDLHRAPVGRAAIAERSSGAPTRPPPAETTTWSPALGGRDRLRPATKPV